MPLRGVQLAVALAAIGGIAVGCGGATPPPDRRVLEREVDDWNFRRYQKLIDVEVWVPDNKASAYTASYARSDAEKRGRLGADDVVNVFVTEYEQPAGVLRAVVKFARRLGQESGYLVEENTLGGQRVLLVTGQGEAWALWGSGRYIVKVGGRGRRDVPASLVSAYGDPYPSGLTSGMLDGALPGGPDEPTVEPEAEPYDPDNPQPDWDRAKRKRKGRKNRK